MRVAGNKLGHLTLGSVDIAIIAPDVAADRADIAGGQHARMGAIATGPYPCTTFHAFGNKLAPIEGNRRIRRRQDLQKI